MTQADSVHSTPPTNTSSRRSFLAQAVVVAAGGGALGMTLPLLVSAGTSEREADPIFEAIEAHKVALSASTVAIRLQSTPEFDPEVERLRHKESDAACVLIAVLPTTLAGALALLRYAADSEKDGTEVWPYDVESDDGSDIRPWHYFLVANLAAVLPELTVVGAA